MWILEIPESSALKFKFKQLLLPPGSRYTLGRSSECFLGGEVDKTVSRANTEIVVAEAIPGSHEQSNARSQVTLMDKSKFGTFVNGIRYKSTDNNAIYVLTQESNTIQLGKFEFDIKILWQPMVVCIVKGAVKPDEAELLRKCDALNIKASHSITHKTSHVICKTVNTPRGLQALIKGLPIVSPDFITAVYDAQDALRKDMSNMPDARDSKFYPTERPGKHDPEVCLPRPLGSDEAKARSTVFEGLEFIFACNHTYSKIAPVIEEGRGKCLLYEGTLTTQDLATFALKCKKPVWVIPKEDDAATLVLEVARRTCTEHIFHGDLLDIILSNGTHNVFRASQATGLMEPIPSSQLGVPSSAMPPLPNMPGSSQMPLSSQMAPPPLTREASVEVVSPPAAKRIRVNAFERMAAMKQTSATTTKRSSATGIHIPKPRAAATPASQSLVMPSLSRVPSSQPPQDSYKTPAKQSTISSFFSRARGSTRKEPTNSRQESQMSQRILAPTEEIEEVEEEAPVYAPAAREFAKKRAAQAAELSIGKGVAAEATSPEALPLTTTVRKRKEPVAQITEDEVMRELETQKEQIDHKATEEAQEAAMDVDEEWTGPAAPLTTFQVKSVAPAIQTTVSNRGHWDPRWEGRPNFKLFRPKGDVEAGDVLEGHYGGLGYTVLLVKDTAKQDLVGMRDLDWLERETREDEPAEQVAVQRNKRSAIGVGRRADPLAFAFDFDGAETNSNDYAESDEDEPATNGRLFIADSDDEVQPDCTRSNRKSKQVSDSEDDVEMVDDDDDFPDTATVRATPATVKSRQGRSTASASQSFATAKSRASNTRPTRASVRTSPASRKSQTQAQESIVLSSDDDDDEPADKLKFRF
ncbi:hypothetical protein BCR37DRAFT_411475 [Protomyces lactucae-debilis]|uniref:FHA domain-containing protein n=1 Tax=Protomyces lactucae-debilis TaxID=2754530 RepID=A0A1Y2FV18_PROLT|nr:uncharacterized protein BCR37DRAFT_411475 [Protomyces lactucae-debilis]ORY87850.1 hypothetical protein BCR37DRAFT_411475 [Protomyces lactucae-debilis]